MSQSQDQRHNSGKLITNELRFTQTMDDAQTPPLHLKTKFKPSMIG